MQFFQSPWLRHEPRTGRELVERLRRQQLAARFGDGRFRRPQYGHVVRR